MDDELDRANDYLEKQTQKLQKENQVLIRETQRIQEQNRLFQEILQRKRRVVEKLTVTLAEVQEEEIILKKEMEHALALA
jgi:SepF-like predicted cell division protein (DUF552 family)